MHTNATLARVNGGTDPTQALGPLAPIDHIRRQVALSLFGDPAPVSAIGRFQIQRMIGAGGMGVVYAATDPQLGRTVALKLIQPTTAGERATERLLREAQAMARLQHPNVVGIHEAGIVGGHVYLAMEYVDGGTLDAWLHAQPRAWQDVLAVLLQAGEGLVAAHAAGLVHRDFKPANVLMSRARARISDFGLARTDAAAEELERTAGDDELLLGQPLTRTDVVLGTPAYMAPEQLRGEVATAASDQFAFAVVTYEALAGHRPFQGDTIGALLTAIEQGRIHPLKRDVPPTLLSVLRRALAVDPAARYPDMTALLTALRGVRTGRRLTRRFMLSAAGAALGLGLLVLGSLPEKPGAPGRSPPLAACDDDPLAEIWDDARRTHVAHALSSGTDPALPVLDAYAVALRAAHRRQCDAAPQALGWTDTCLADRRTALADLTHAILVGSPELRTGAAAAARELLPSLTDCEQPVPYLTLVSEAHRDQRWTAWQLRLAHADAFGPRPTTRAPRLHLVGATLGNVVGAMRGTGDPRVVHETGFATLVAGLHAEDRTDRDPLATAVDLGRRTADTNHADLAARAWVLAAELLEARPHAEGAREEAWTAAAKALGQLPKAHPLRLRLHRDLAHVELAHARHATPAGACSRGEADFAACRSIFTAISDLTDVAADPSATPADLELLARAHDHAGDAAAATATRARATPIDLDERSLGFLEFVAAAAPDVPDPAAGTRCTDDDARCEVERALASRLAADPVRLIDGARYMMSVHDGTPRGIKVYAVRAGASLNLLGFKNGDLVTAIDGAAPNADDFVRKLQDLLARGAGTLEVQRKGAATVRRISVR
jgi:hypothetical protein